MNENLILLMIFILVLIIMFWLMNDKSANRVTKSLSTLSKILPLSKIANAVIEYFKSKKNNKSSE